MLETKTAFVFPGQASQHSGMGLDLYINSPAARKTFRNIDEILNIPLSKIMFYGSTEELMHTENAQLAVATMSIAIWQVMEERTDYMLIPTIVAGHSLGEYTALFICGVLDLEQTINLISKRSKLMEKACRLNPGSMVAIIGLDLQTAQEVCSATGTELSNINAPGQIIVSGSHKNLVTAIDLAAARGAKRCIPLKVGGAFHSSLMNCIQDELDEYIEQIEFSTPYTPIVSNITALPMSKTEEIKADLKKQLQHCVNWELSIQNMANGGFNNFVEVGPGRVQHGIIKRILSNLSVFSISDYKSAMEFIAPRN